MTKEINKSIYDKKDFESKDEDFILGILLYKIFEDSTLKISRINKDMIFDYDAYDLLYKNMYWYEIEKLSDNTDIIIEMLENKELYSFIKNQLKFKDKYYV